MLHCSRGISYDAQENTSVHCICGDGNADVILRRQRSKDSCSDESFCFETSSYVSNNVFRAAAGKLIEMEIRTSSGH